MGGRKIRAFRQPKREAQGGEAELKCEVAERKMALREDGWKEEKWRAKRTGRSEEDGK